MIHNSFSELGIPWDARYKKSWWPVVAAAASIGASMWANQQNADSQRQVNSDQIQLSKEQMAWQQSMSNSAHTREVEDLKSAGLNPNLSAGGNGASTPSGSTPNLTAPQINAPPILEIITAAQNQQRIDMEQAKTNAMLKKVDPDIENTKSRTLLNKRGAPRAILEGEISTFLNNAIRSIKSQKSVKPRLNPGNPNNYDPSNDSNVYQNMR